MKPSAPFPSDNADAVENMAAAWLAERDEGLGAEQAAAFARWRAADPRHEAAVARLESAWTAMQELRNFRPAAAKHPDYDILTRGRQAGEIVAFPRWAGALAAAAVVALGAFFLWPAGRNAPAAAPRLATSPTGYERTTLPDGSVVDLNGGTEVRVDYGPAERRVVLLRGEAMFSVAKNPARPFIVQAGAVAVRAVGTAFNVKKADAGIVVLVTEGKVQVQQAVAGLAEPVVVAPLLEAGSQLTVNATPAAVTAPAVVEKLEPTVIREALAWQEPRLRFVDTPLSEAVAQFNARGPVKLVLGDNTVGQLTVDGSFRPDNAEAFVRLLVEEGSVLAERTDPQHIVLRRAPQP